MNQTLENIKTRRSCRKYVNRQITDEELNAVLEAGLYAPSGMDKQSPIFIAIQDPEIIAELAIINKKYWIKQGEHGFYYAPTVIVVLSKPSICKTFALDAMASVQNMLIAAESLGLAAACVSRAKEEFESEYGKSLLKKLGIDEDYIGIEHVVLGYREGEKTKASARNENRIFRL